MKRLKNKHSVDDLSPRKTPKTRNGVEDFIQLATDTFKQILDLCKGSLKSLFCCSKTLRNKFIHQFMQKLIINIPSVRVRQKEYIRYARYINHTARCIIPKDFDYPYLVELDMVLTMQQVGSRDFFRCMPKTLTTLSIDTPFELNTDLIPETVTELWVEYISEGLSDSEFTFGEEYRPLNDVKITGHIWFIKGKMPNSLRSLCISAHEQHIHFRQPDGLVEFPPNLTFLDMEGCQNDPSTIHFPDSLVDLTWTIGVDLLKLPPSLKSLKTDDAGPIKLPGGLETLRLVGTALHIEGDIPSGLKELSFINRETIPDEATRRVLVGLFRKDQDPTIPSIPIDMETTQVETVIVKIGSIVPSIVNIMRYNIIPKLTKHLIVRGRDSYNTTTHMDLADYPELLTITSPDDIRVWNSNRCNCKVIKARASDLKDLGE